MSILVQRMTIFTAIMMAFAIGMAMLVTEPQRSRDRIQPVTLASCSDAGSADCLRLL